MTEKNVDWDIKPQYKQTNKISVTCIIFSFIGNLTARHKEVFLRNPLFVGMRLPEVKEITPLEKKFPRISNFSLAFLKVSIALYID